MSRRLVWRNHFGNQQVEPLKIFRPTSLAALVAIVQEAENQQITVRAVGSGHAWSDVALGKDYMVDTHALNQDLPLDSCKSGYDAKYLIRTEAGITVRQLNRRLEGQGLALSSMGGWDAQTIAGVISTSTHGSGKAYGPMSDQVRSIDIVASGGVVYRIEPPSGPTDKSAFAAAHPGWMLVQNESWFNSVLVGMGCLGVIYAVTLEVEPFYWLKEERYLKSWGQIEEALRNQSLENIHEHIEVYVNLHCHQGRRLCLVTQRNKVLRPELRSLLPHRNVLPEILCSFPSLTSGLLRLIIGRWPAMSPPALNWALRLLVRPSYIDKWYKVMQLGAANRMPAYAMEIAVPRSRLVEAMNIVFAVAERYRASEAIYATSPLSIRFVKQSPAYMSMMYGRETAMIELIQLSHSKGGFALLAQYEQALRKIGGRPHWGQYHTLTGGRDVLAKLYPKYDEWLKVFGVLNRTGVFNSPFTQRMGISSPARPLDN